MLWFKAYEFYRCKTKFIQEITIPSFSLTKTNPIFIDEAYELNHWIFDGGISNHSYSQLALLVLCSSATQIWYAFWFNRLTFSAKILQLLSTLCYLPTTTTKRQKCKYADPCLPALLSLCTNNYLSNKNQVSLRMTIWARKIWRGWQVHYTIIIQQILYPQFLPPDLEISRSDRQRRISQMIKSIW